MAKKNVLFDLQLSSFDGHGDIKFASDSNYVFFSTMAGYVKDNYNCFVLAPEKCADEIQKDLGQEIGVFPIKYGTDYYTARFQFDLEKVAVAVQACCPDLIWTNNPIWVPFYKAVLRKLGKDIAVLSYNHWIDLPSTRKEEKKYTLEYLQVAGTLASDGVLANSAWGMKLIKDGVRESSGHQIEAPMFAFPPPLQAVSAPSGDLERHCIYNHRISSHPYYKDALARLEHLMLGLGMPVVFTNPSGKEPLHGFPFPARFVSWSKQQYLDSLAKAYCSVSTLIDVGAQWSMSIVESVASSVPTLVPFSYGYAELLPKEYPLYYSDIEQGRRLLASLLEERTDISKYSDYVKREYGKDGTMARFEELMRAFV